MRMIRSIADGGNDNLGGFDNGEEEHDGEIGLRSEERTKQKRDKLRREFLRKELSGWSVCFAICYHLLLLLHYHYHFFL